MVSIAKVTVNLVKVWDELTNLLKRPSDCLVSIIHEPGRYRRVPVLEKLATNLRAVDVLIKGFFSPRELRSWKYSCCFISSAKSNWIVQPLSEDVLCHFSTIAHYWSIFHAVPRSSSSPSRSIKYSGESAAHSHRGLILLQDICVQTEDSINLCWWHRRYIWSYIY